MFLQAEVEKSAYIYFKTARLDRDKDPVVNMYTLLSSYRVMRVLNKI